jgi:hypothetical protein
MSKSEQRRDRDAVRQIDEEPETKTEMTLSERLEKRRLDELEKKIQEERADKLADIKERLSGPIKAQTLSTKLGGNAPSVIDKFFSDADGDLN